MVKPPLIMGILNVTPDSFSDGGRFFSLDAALKQAEHLVTEGADILDIGGESSRPGADPVPLDEELARVCPVIEAIRARLPIRLSIDTTKYEVAARAVDLGVEIINDISAGADARMADLGQNQGVTFLLMHRQGTPKTMQGAPSYPRGVVVEVADFLRERVRCFLEAGVDRERLWVDPGIGFGKTFAQNLELLRELEAFEGIGDRLAIGTSRKSFLGKIAEGDRLAGTIASSLWAWAHGVSVLRVHEVRPLREAMKTWGVIRDRQS